MEEKMKDTAADQVDLHFTAVDAFDTGKKERKPFPGDFSFSKDGTLNGESSALDPIPDLIPQLATLDTDTDSEIEEDDYEILQETGEENEEIPEALFEEFYEGIEESDDVTEEGGSESDEAEDSEEFSAEFSQSINGFSSIPSQSDSGFQQTSEGCEETAGYGFFQDSSDTGDGGSSEEGSSGRDEDEDIYEVIWEEPSDTSDSVSDNLEGDNSEIDNDDDDDDDSALWEEFKDVFESEEELEDINELTGEDVFEEEDELEEEFEDEAVFVCDVITPEESGEEIAEQDIRSKFVDLSETEVEVAGEIAEETSEEESLEEEDYTEFSEDEDSDCDVISVPKNAISISTWDRVRQRAAATQEQQESFETENFFAVTASYINHSQGQYQERGKTKRSEESVVVQLTGVASASQEGLRATQSEEESESNFEPIWQVDELPEVGDDINEEDLDYDDIFNDDQDAFQRKRRKKNLLKRIFKEIGLFLIIAFCAIFLVVNFTVLVNRQNTVYGSSMEPTLYEGDRVYTTMLPYIFGSPEVGDVVVFDYSRHEKGMGYFYMIGEVLRNNRITQWMQGKENMSTDVYWIKRVVAVAGDTVEFRDGQFYRNGELVVEDYILSQTMTKYPENQVIKVEEGHVFVMGDNRYESQDSRYIGCISEDIIIGKMWRKV